MAEPTSRITKLRAMLEKHPTDTFLLYGLAIEHKKADDRVEAIGLLDRVIQLDPGYCYAYHQQGLIYEANEDLEAARNAYRAGIEAAKTKGDEHARGELQAALEMIEDG